MRATPTKTPTSTSPGTPTGTRRSIPGLLAACAVALAAVPAGAQDADPSRPGGPGTLAPEPPAPEQRSESGAASGGATGFALQDGGYAALPDTAPPPADSPRDPEDRPENDDRDEDGDDERDVTIIVPEPFPTPAPSPTPAERRTADVPNTAGEEGTSVPDALPPVRERLAETDAEFAACTARLSALGTSFEAVRPLVETRDPDCGIVRPVKVSEIVPGVALRPDALMRCATARALAEWTAAEVVPAAEALGASVSAIDHGSTYICRRRNNAATGRLSEHAFGNAVDVMGFGFADREPVRIEPREPGGPVATFQRSVREASCEHFTTVIGPGTNAAHADHLHLDVKERRGGYRLCE